MGGVEKGMKVVCLILSLLLAWCLIQMASCGKPEIEPELEPSIITADCDDLYSNYLGLEFEHGILKAQLELQNANYTKLLEDYLNADYKYEESIKPHLEQYEDLLAQYNELRGDLRLVGDRKDPVINLDYPSDNDTAKAEWNNFYELWDRWYEE